MKHEIKWKLLIPALLLPLAVGGLAALLTGAAMDSYSQVQRPPLSPPGWVFPVVWSILYILMGLASYLVLTAPVSGERKERALSLYLLQSGKAERIIATDINKAPLQKAVDLITGAGYGQKAEFYLTDGLQNIGKTDDIIQI